MFQRGFFSFMEFELMSFKIILAYLFPFWTFLPLEEEVLDIK